MNKNALHQAIQKALEEVLDSAIHAAKQAHETATHTETVAENKYDTFGLEASYLAAGQSKRVAQAEADLQQFLKLPVKDFDEATPVTYGALVSLVDRNDLRKYIFLSPVAGGLSLEFEGKQILLVSKQALLGKALMGACLDDELNVGDSTYLIERLW